MTVFLDISGNEYIAQTNFKVTHGVNGELSVSGEIVSNEEVLRGIDRGWRLKFNDEYFYITYQNLQDEGENTSVTFDAVHEFFWIFSKSPIYQELTSTTSFRKCLEFIFKDSGYRYFIDPKIQTDRFTKQNFGMKDRLSLFNELVLAAGVEFNVSGKVVSIYKEVGTDLSTVVRKNLNLNELSVTRNIGNFITYQRGFGKWKDENDHTKGRLEVEYESPLAKVYGRLEGVPVVDERYSVANNLLSVLKKNVDNSYTLSVELSMEDLTGAGYPNAQPREGDYIMVVDEEKGFRERVRIISYTSSYDVRGNLIDHQVTCNDIGAVKKQNAIYKTFVNQVKSTEENLANVQETANRALVAADGKSTNYYGTDFPIDVPKGTLKSGDLFYRQVGEQTVMHVWNGHEWIADPVVNELGSLKDHIRSEFNKVNTELAQQEQEHNQAVDDLLTKARANRLLAEEAKALTDETASDLNLVKDTVKSHTRTIIEQGQSISQVVQTAQGLVSRVSVLMDAQNLVYDPTRYSKYIPRNSTSNLQLAAYSSYSGMRIRASGLSGDTYSGFRLPLRTSNFAKGEKLSLRAVIGIDALPDSGGQIKFEIKNSGVIIAHFWLNPTRTGNNQVFTATTTVDVTTSRIDEYGLDVLINRNGNVNITQISIVRGDQIPSTFVDSTTAQDLAISTQVGQLAGSWAVQNLTSAGTVLNQINLLANGNNRIDGRLTHITGRTLIDNGVIKSAMIDKLDAGKITTGTLDASRARIINLDASSVTSGTFTGLTFRGGRIEALNSAMYINLNNAEMVLAKDASITFTSEKNVLRRSVSGFGNQFLKFETGQFTRNGVTGYKSNKTLIGSNRSGSENAEDGNFAGLRIWNMNPPQGQSAFDQIDVIGDLIVFEDSATSPGRSPWIMQTYNKDGDLAFYPENSGGKRHVLGMSNRRFKAVHTDELWINGVRLKQILKDISNRIGYAGVDNWASKMG